MIIPDWMREPLTSGDEFALPISGVYSTQEIYAAAVNEYLRIEPHGHTPPNLASPYTWGRVLADYIAMQATLAAAQEIIASQERLIFSLNAALQAKERNT